MSTIAIKGSTNVVEKKETPSKSAEVKLGVWGYDNGVLPKIYMKVDGIEYNLFVIGHPKKQMCHFGLGQIYNKIGLTPKDSHNYCGLAEED